jgi:hypothetical protein
MRIPVSIRASYNMANIKALVDKPKNIYNIDDTTNKSGQITHYLSLAVTTAGKTQEMRFLITDIGREDVLLGYPWLSTYEPRFSWRHGTIDESNLPIVLRTINPNDRKDVVLRYLSTDECAEIVAELERDVGGEPPTIRNASVELAVAAQQYTKKWKSRRNTRSLRKYSAKKNRSGSHQGDHAIMPLSSNQAHRTPSNAKYTQ